jgi:DNA-binding beta-propeller fold protein YncE
MKHVITTRSRVIALLLAALPLGMAPARADVIVSANDNHTTVEGGKSIGALHPKPDNVSVIDMAQDHPRLRATIEVPFSDIGPPMAVAVAPDESFAIVTSSTRADATAPDRAVPDDRVSVIDLRSNPPQLVQQLHAGAGATTVRIAPDGKVALVVNRLAGTISIFSIDNGRLVPAGTFALDNPKALPAGLGFSHDGSIALVSRAGDNKISVLHVNGTQLSLDPRPLTTGIAPDTLDVNAAGTLAAVTNIGRGDGDVDSVSLIDLAANPPRTIDTAAVPNGPEGVRFSPDGKYVAVNSLNGTIQAAGTPFHHERGVLTLFALGATPAQALATAGTRLRKVAEAPVGGWSQGIAFSRDGRVILVQNMRDHTISVFRWQDGRLTGQPPLAMPGGPASIQTPWP